MAKANNTAIETLIAKLEDMIDKVDGNHHEGIRIAIRESQKLLQINNAQIKSAFMAGANGNYTDSSHYFFMEYIDND